jgi:hypothetical protein
MFFLDAGLINDVCVRERAYIKTVAKKERSEDSKNPSFYRVHFTVKFIRLNILNNKKL